MFFRKLRLLLLVVVIDVFQEAEAAVTSCCDRCFSGAEAAVTSCCGRWSKWLIELSDKTPGIVLESFRCV